MVFNEDGEVFRKKGDYFKMDSIKTKEHVAGFKQSKKSIEAGRAEFVYVARDADMHIVFPIERLCEEKGVKIEYVNNMKELAKASGIDVPTAVVTIVKNV